MRNLGLMDLRDLRIIDVDAHITEPADLWTRRAPAGYADRVPHVVDVDGNQFIDLGAGLPASPMTSDRELTQTYAPNPILRALYQRFFDKIQVDEAWVREVRALSERGSVVYVLRSLNFIDFFALDYLTKRHRLPQVRFVNDLGLWILNPASVRSSE